MSLYSSINELKIKLQQKNMIVLSGNVYDIFPKVKDGEMKRTNISIAEFISDELKLLGYNRVERFSPKTGLTELISNSKILDKKVQEHGVTAFEDSNKENEQFESMPFTYENFLNKIINEVKDFEPEDGLKKAYIIDFTDIFFYKKEETEGKNILAELLALFLDVLQPKFKEVGERTPKLIFIQRNGNQLPPTMKIDNPELALVEVMKPDNSERSKWFKRFALKLYTSDSELIQDTKTKEHDQAVALTSKLSFRELIQLSRIKDNIEDDITFKELYTLAYLNSRESAWTKLSKKQIKEIPQKFKKSLFGQDDAIDKLQKTLILSKMGMSNATHSSSSAKPKGVLFLVGPTGTGKTELAKMLTREVFGDEKNLIRFDMSEYSSPESGGKFIGSDPGYVGYEAGGQLTNAVKQNPFSVLLFDEIEKADDQVLDKFLQILDDGRLTSSQGELIDFSETFIIFTSNKGYENTSPDSGKEENRKAFHKGVVKYFSDPKKAYGTGGLGRPELLNRINENNIVVFNYITNESIIRSLIRSKFTKVNELFLKRHKVKINVNQSHLDGVIDIIKEAYDKKMGGRGLNTAIQKTYVESITEYLFEKYDVLEARKKDEISNLKITTKGSKLIFDLDK